MTEFRAEWLRVGDWVHSNQLQAVVLITGLFFTLNRVSSLVLDRIGLFKVSPPRPSSHSLRSAILLLQKHPDTIPLPRIITRVDHVTKD